VVTNIFYFLIYGTILPIDQYFSRWSKPPTRLDSGPGDINRFCGWEKGLSEHSVPLKKKMQIFLPSMATNRVVYPID
jgi:hypothetical protein